MLRSSDHQWKSTFLSEISDLPRAAYTGSLKIMPEGNQRFLPSFFCSILFKVSGTNIAWSPRLNKLRSTHHIPILLISYSSSSGDLYRDPLLISNVIDFSDCMWALYVGMTNTNQIYKPIQAAVMFT